MELDFTGRYQHRLAAGLRITAIGGSDWHQPADLQPELLRPGNADDGLLSRGTVGSGNLKAMKSGHGYITEGPDGPHLSITADGKPMGSVTRRAREVVATVRGATGDRLTWIDASGEVESVIIPSDDATLTLEFPAD